MALTRFASTRLSNSRPTLTSRADNAKRITNVRGNSAKIANPSILLPYYVISAPTVGVVEGLTTAITVRGYNLPRANQNGTLYWSIASNAALFGEDQFDSPRSGSFTITYAGNIYGYSVGTFNVTANVDSVVELTGSANTSFTIIVRENSTTSEEIVGVSANITINNPVIISVPPTGTPWSVSTTDPIIAWDNTNNLSQMYFAVPANSAGEVTTTWQYANSPWTSWSNFGGAAGNYVAVTGGVTFNGTLYNGYFRSTGWTKGNPTYHQRAGTSSLGLKESSGEATALSNASLPLIYQTSATL